MCPIAAMFAIVEFINTKEIDFVPLKWVADTSIQIDIPTLIKSKQPVLFYWPPMKAPLNVSRAKDRSISAEVGWPTYMARILGTAKDLGEARAKTKRAEETSSIEDVNDETQKKKRKLKKVFDTSSSCDSDSGDVDVGNENQPLLVKRAKKTGFKSSSSSNAIQSAVPITLPIPPPLPPKTFLENAPCSRMTCTPENVKTAVTQETQCMNTLTSNVSKMTSTPHGLHLAECGTPLQTSTMTNLVGSNDTFTEWVPSSTPSYTTLSNQNDLTTTQHCRQYDTPLPISTNVVGRNETPTSRVSNSTTSSRTASFQEMPSTPLHTSIATALNDKDTASATSCEESETLANDKLSLTALSRNSATSQVLLKLLTGLEQVKHTQKVQSAILNSIYQQLKLKESTTTSSLVPELPDNIQFPLTSVAEVDALEMKLRNDVSTKKLITSVICDIGGKDTSDLVKRVMRFLLSDDLAMKYNFTGQKGKYKFGSLQLNNIVFDVAKQNPPTSSVTKKDVETQIMTWFDGARDRGEHSRKKTNKVVPRN